VASVGGYLRLPVALVLGTVLFHEFPDTPALIGSGLIIASAIAATGMPARYLKSS
jgi:drug/metabolite transporter (DMT)-like permease